MLYCLKPLLKKAKLPVKSVKAGEKGICQFCARKVPLVEKDVIRRWLEGSGNPGITKSAYGLPRACADCTEMLISGIKPYKLKAAFNGSVLFVSGYRENGEEVAEGLLFKSEEAFKEYLISLEKGKYIFLFILKSGNYLPIVDLPNLQVSTNPSVSLSLNIVEGSVMNTVVIPTPLIFKDENSPLKGLIKFLRKKTLSGGSK